MGTDTITPAETAGPPKPPDNPGRISVDPSYLDGPDNGDHEKPRAGLESVNARQPDMPLRNLDQTPRQEVRPSADKSPVVVDNRLMGGTAVRGILCRHGIQDAGAIARQLDGVRIATFEGPLSDEHRRASDEAAYTKRVSRPLDLDGYRWLRDSTGNQLAAIIGGLIGGGPKTIRLVDVAPGSEGWEEYQHSLRALDGYSHGMNRFPRVEAARTARHRLTGILATSNEARENTMHPRLQKIADEASQGSSPNEMGVVLGLSHLQLVRRLGEPLDPKRSAEAEKRVAEIASPAALAVIALRDGADPSAHISRALLSDYAQRASFGDSQTRIAIHTAIQTLSPTEVEQWLEIIDQAIADTTDELYLRRNLSAALRNLPY